MKRIALLWGIFLIGMLLLSCAPKGAPVEKPAAPETIAPKVITAGKDDWEIEWEKVLREAKKEGSLTLYTSMSPEPRAQLRRAFKEKFDINIEIVAGRAIELVTKIMTERKAGLYLTDLYISGPTSAVALLKPIGALENVETILLLPEVLDKKAWWGGEGIIWVDKERTFIQYRAMPTSGLAINTSLVKPGEITSYKDLLNQKWKGKIILNDPSLGQSGSKTLSWLARIALGWDYIEALAKQEPLILRDERQIAEWVARGRYPISLGATKEVDVFREAGMPISEIYPIEGGRLSAGSHCIALLNKAPHLKASIVYINWLLSREGQTIVSRADFMQSAREDVSVDHLDPQQRRQPGVSYFNEATEKWSLIAFNDREIFGKIFSHLIK